MGYIAPTQKIKGKHKLNSIIRDIHAGYSNKTVIPLDMTTEQLSRKSSVDVTYKKFMGKKHGYYRYYYYKAYTRMKPTAKIALGHPVNIQRKHRYRGDP